MTRRDVTVFIVAALMTSCRTRSLPGPVHYEMAEKLSVGTELGQGLVADAALDTIYSTDELRRLQFSLATGLPPDLTSHYFTIDQRTGRIQLKSVVDRDVLCPRQDTCRLEFDVVIGPADLFNIISINLTVHDVNDHRPQFADTSTLMLNVAESAAPGTQFQLPAAVDLDSPSLGVARYELFPVSVRSVFTVQWRVAGDVRLVVAGALDRESRDRYDVTLVAFDGGSPALNGSASVDVIVDDVNDNAPVFERSSYQTHVDENATAGTHLLTLVANDADLSDNGHVVYALQPTEPDDVITRQLFTVNATSGDVTLALGQLDRELVPVYRLTVVAHDLGVPRLSTSVVIRVDVLDINDVEPRIAVSSLTSDALSHVSESAAIGTFVALVFVSDSDVGDNGNTWCQLVPDRHFALVELQRSAKYKVVTRSLLDRETRAEYQLNITCSDRGQPPLTSRRDVTVAVDDVNDNAPYFRSGEYNFTLAENNDIGQSLGQVGALDGDIGDNARLDYVITGDLASTVNFRVDAETGVLRAVAMLDYETAPHAGFRFQIEARDHGSPSLTATANITVIVTDVNDVAPRFFDRSYTFVTPENQRRGTVVGHVIAIDPEAGEFGVVRYSFGASALSEAFDIDSMTGTITTRRPLDRELFPVYRIVVVAYNNDSVTLPRLSGTADVTVYVADVNDHAPEVELPAVSEAGQFPVYVSSGLSRGRRATRIIAHDADTGNNATLGFYLRGDDESFIVDPTTGVVYVDADLTAISEQTFIYRVLVVDKGVPPLSTAASLTIIVNSSIAVPPPSLDDLVTYGNVSARSSTPGQRLLSSSNFIAVVVVGATTAVVVVVLLTAIIYVVCRHRRQAGPRAALNNRHVYKPDDNDAQGTGSQENLATQQLQTGNGNPCDDIKSPTNSFPLLTTSGGDGLNNCREFGSFGKPDNRKHQSTLKNGMSTTTTRDNDSLSSDSGRGPSEEEFRPNSQHMDQQHRRHPTDGICRHSNDSRESYGFNTPHIYAVAFTRRPPNTSSPGDVTSSRRRDSGPRHVTFADHSAVSYHGDEELGQGGGGATGGGYGSTDFSDVTSVTSGSYYMDEDAHQQPVSFIFV